MFKWDSTHTTSREGGALQMCPTEECAPQMQAMADLKSENDKQQRSQSITLQYSSFHFVANKHAGRL